jgi:7-keto-8-aminopelargonate synthetase-like enzyme
MDFGVELFINEARLFVFSTGLAPPAVGATHEAFRITCEGGVREALWSNVELPCDGLESLGYEGLGKTQVLPVLVGDRDAAPALANKHEERDLVAPAVRPSSIPEVTTSEYPAPADSPPVGRGNRRAHH